MEFLLTGAAPGRATILLAHGAGAPMDTPWMTQLAEALAGKGFRVARFEFAYMAARRTGGPKRPPFRAERHVPEYLAAVDALGAEGPLIIGGKSMGGRVASLAAGDLFTQGRVAGLLCLGFPFHPPAKPDPGRAAHLASIACPTLICQGTRDPFGSRDDVGGYPLSEAVTLRFLEDGDHDLKPRKRLTGRSLGDHLAEVAAQVADWCPAR